MLKNVFFKKPDYKYLKDNNFLAFDMHVHTKYSDGANRVTTILKKAKKLGIGVAITDHNMIQGAVKAFNNHFGVPVIPGIEVTTKEGLHILLYFNKIEDLKDYYVKYIKYERSKHPYLSTNVSTVDVIKKAKKYNCVISAAHPFSPTKMGLATSIKRKYLPKSIIKEIDAMEVVCGSHLNYMNHKAIKWAWELDKPITSGSDAHTLSDVGRILTYSQSANIVEFLKKIIHKENFVVGTGRCGASRIIQYISMAPISAISRHIEFLGPVVNAKYHSWITQPIEHYIPNVINKLKKKINVHEKP